MAFFEGLLELTVELFFDGMAYGAVRSWDRQHAVPASDAGHTHLRERVPGEAVLPMFRPDVAHQPVDSNLSAWDFRAEAGYAYAGVSARVTRDDE